MSTAPELARRIAEATEDLAVAQREVERAMRELSSGAIRADKTIITEVLRTAFEKLTTAREKLAVLATEGSVAP